MICAMQENCLAIGWNKMERQQMVPEGTVSYYSLPALKKGPPVPCVAAVGTVSPPEGLSLCKTKGRRLLNSVSPRFMSQNHQGRQIPPMLWPIPSTSSFTTPESISPKMMKTTQIESFNNHSTATLTKSPTSVFKTCYDNSRQLKEVSQHAMNQSATINSTVEPNRSKNSLSHVLQIMQTTTPLLEEAMTVQEEEERKEKWKRGRWTPEEEKMAQWIISVYQSGKLLIQPNTLSLRKFLAKVFNCSPMRISKKFPGSKNRQGSRNEEGDEDDDEGDEDEGENDNDCNRKQAAALFENKFLIHEERTFKDINHEKKIYRRLKRQKMNISDGDCFAILEDGNGDVEENEASKSLMRMGFLRLSAPQTQYLRRGRWTHEEEMYANSLIEAFKAGKLPVREDDSLRKFLAKLLCCDPMRISKKYSGCVRKYRFYKRKGQPNRVKDHKEMWLKLLDLERKFLHSVSRFPNGEEDNSNPSARSEERNAVQKKSSNSSHCNDTDNCNDSSDSKMINRAKRFCLEKKDRFFSDGKEKPCSASMNLSDILN